MVLFEDENFQDANFEVKKCEKRASRASTFFRVFGFDENFADQTTLSELEREPPRIIQYAKNIHNQSNELILFCSLELELMSCLTKNLDYLFEMLSDGVAAKLEMG